ncbi:hypothetical protein D3C86_1306260 [compost metagenome]
MSLVTEGAHSVHLDLAGARIDRKDGIAQIAHLILHPVNLAVQLVLLQDGIYPHLTQVVLLIAQQVFGLL